MLDRPSRELAPNPAFIQPEALLPVDTGSHTRPHETAPPLLPVEPSDITAAPPTRGHRLPSTECPAANEAVVPPPATVPQVVGEIAIAKQMSPGEAQPPESAADTGGGRNDDPPTDHNRPVPSEPDEPDELRKIVSGEVELAPAIKTERLVSYKDAKDATQFLENDGSRMLAESAGAHSAEARMLAEAQDTAERFIAASPDDYRVQEVSSSYHRFEAAAAGSLDEARGMLDAYDHLRPHEQPVDALIRKEAVIGHHIDVQVLRAQARQDAQYASEVSGPECQLPDGFDVYGVRTRTTPFRYDDVAALEQDISTYYAALSADPHDWPPGSPNIDFGPLEDWPLSDEISEVGMGKLVVHRVRAAYQMYRLNAVGQPARLGVEHNERFAHIVGKPLAYSPLMEVILQAPMQPTIHDRVAVPFYEIATTLAQVTGQPGMAEITPDQHRLHRFAFPGGSIDFSNSGVFDDGTVGTGRDHTRRATFRADLYLEGQTASYVELATIAKRLSAWLKQSASPQANSRPVS